MSAEEIFRNYVRQIGIGGIAMAGLIGIIRSSRIIAGAFSLAYREIFQRPRGPGGDARADADGHQDALHHVLILLTALRSSSSSPAASCST